LFVAPDVLLRLKGSTVAKPSQQGLLLLGACGMLRLLLSREKFFLRCLNVFLLLLPLLTTLLCSGGICALQVNNLCGFGKRCQAATDCDSGVCDPLTRKCICSPGLVPQGPFCTKPPALPPVAAHQEGVGYAVKCSAAAAAAAAAFSWIVELTDVRSATHAQLAQLKAAALLRRLVSLLQAILYMWKAVCFKARFQCCARHNA
jgi:hypothetical protein